MFGSEEPVVDIDESLTIDCGDLEGKISPRTKAIMVIHMANRPCNIDRIMAIANRCGIPVVEDACQAVGEYREMLLRRSPFGITVVISLANDFVGYLPTDAMLGEGAYEARICPLRPIEAELVAQADRVLAATRQQQRALTAV